MSIFEVHVCDRRLKRADTYLARSKSSESATKKALAAAKKDGFRDPYAAHVRPSPVKVL